MNETINPNGSTPVVLSAGSEVSTLVSFDETAECPVTTLEIGEHSKDRHACRYVDCFYFVVAYVIACFTVACVYRNERVVVYVFKLLLNQFVRTVSVAYEYVYTACCYTANMRLCELS